MSLLGRKHHSVAPTIHGNPAARSPNPIMTAVITDLPFAEEEIEMSEQEKTLMTEYGITSSPKTVYFYKEYRYDRLSDALSYAKNDTNRSQEGGESTPSA